MPCCEIQINYVKTGLSSPASIPLQGSEMMPNPILGVFLHWLGGLAVDSFYVPFRAVRKSSWETDWLVGGVFSGLVMPWLLGLRMTRDLIPTRRQFHGVRVCGDDLARAAGLQPAYQVAAVL